ncbi:MAG TPA: NAD(P)-dependent oxidoreductase, partial [Candidatus Bathyarchaeia archaeon]|nr:NAD(P)-dependent oxidoreductase [Candidatus Bathyarchaeia archaeon]
MKTVLVTGGAGYIGSILVRRLLDHGYKVVCVDSLMHGGESIDDILSASNFVFYKCDITRYEDLEEILSRHQYFAVVNLAAIVGDPACKAQPELARKINLDAPLFLVDRCLKLKIPRFIFASTCSNYGKMSDPEGYVDENSTLTPVSLYAELKVEVEDYLMNKISRVDYFSPTLLRFSTVYGLSSRMRFDLTVNEFTKELVLGKELVVFGEQFWRPYCHVSDIARAIVTVLDASSDKIAYEVFNVGDTKENYTKKMIVDEIRKYIPDANIKYIRKDEDPRDYRVSFEKIKRELNFTISKIVPDGILEVMKAIRKGEIG